MPKPMRTPAHPRDDPRRGDPRGRPLAPRGRPTRCPAHGGFDAGGDTPRPYGGRVEVCHLPVGVPAPGWKIPWNKRKRARIGALFGCCLLMASCATVQPGVLSDFSEMKAEVAVPIWRNILLEAPYGEILESAGPVADKHCSSVGRKPVFVSMRGVDLRGAVVVAGVGASNTGDAIVLYRCEKERDDVEASIRLGIAAIHPDFVTHMWDQLTAVERQRLKEDEHFRRAVREGARRAIFDEMERVLQDLRRQAPPAG